MASSKQEKLIYKRLEFQLLELLYFFPKWSTNALIFFNEDISEQYGKTKTWRYFLHMLNSLGCMVEHKSSKTFSDTIFSGKTVFHTVYFLASVTI